MLILSFKRMQFRCLNGKVDNPYLKTMFDVLYMPSGLEIGQYMGSILQLYLEDD